MSSQPLVSIIMPTHNPDPGFLREAVDSCIAQTHDLWELIIVDDGSSHEAAAILTEQAARDPRIRLLRHAANRRLPAALNTGTEQARGGFLTWLSDDDRFRPAALERMLGFLLANPDTDIVYTDYSLLFADGRVGTRMRVGRPEEIGIRKPVGICHLARYAAFAETGFSEAYFLAEDLDFWVRACMRYQLSALHEDLALYRQHAMTLTQTYPRIEVLAVHRRILDQHLPGMHWLGPRGKAHAYLRLGKNLLAQRALLPGLSALARAARFFLPACTSALSEGLAQRFDQGQALRRP